MRLEKMLIKAMVNLDEDKVVRFTHSGLKSGIRPIDIIEDLLKGTDKVRELYQKGSYYDADLIMASMIFKSALSILPLEQCNKGEPEIIIGTVKEDIHETGKDIIVGLLRSNGMSVLDLGVDVSPEKFVKAIVSHRVKVVGLSGSTLSSFHGMKNTISAIETAGLRKKVHIIIGGMVDEKVKELVGADSWTNNGATGVRLCHNILQAMKI